MIDRAVRMALSSAAWAFRTSFSVFWRSCFIPAPLAHQVLLAGKVLLGPFERHLRLDDRGELVDVDRPSVGTFRDRPEDHADLGQLGQELLLGLVDRQVGVSVSNSTSSSPGWTRSPMSWRTLATRPTRLAPRSPRPTP